MNFQKGLLLAILSALVMTGFIISNLFAGEKYESETGYSIELPKKWTRNVQNKGASLVVTSPDKRAELRLNVYEMEKKKTATEILTGIEKNLGMENLLDETDIPISGELLRQFRATEGVKGIYRIPADSGNILYTVYILLKGNKFFLVGKGVVEEYKKEYTEALDGIVASIRLAGEGDDFIYDQEPTVTETDDDDDESITNDAATGDDDEVADDETDDDDDDEQAPDIENESDE